MYSFTTIYCKLNTYTLLKLFVRTSGQLCSPSAQSGLVIGVYDTPEGSQEFTKAGEKLNEESNGLLKDMLRKKYIKYGEAEIFSGLGIGGATHLALTSIGCKTPEKLNLVEQLNEEKEHIRVGIAVGARKVQDAGASKISIDGATVPEAAAEGAILGTFKYNANVTTGDNQIPTISLYENPNQNSWESGVINAEAQNWARYLSHAPPNLTTPMLFAEEIMKTLCKFDVTIGLRDKEWMVGKDIYAALSLTKSSCKPPILIELGYCGDDPPVKPIVLIGKGSTFDSGGLFLKPYKGIHDFRADMAGAATVVGTMMAVARKRLPINVKAVILLYEVMPSPMGVKPGDVIKDKNGNHIHISDPDNDCRTVLADIVNFTSCYHPQLLVDVGTFTKSVAHALGLAAAGAFVSNTPLWCELQRAGLESGDRFWRFPLWKYFTELISGHRSCDFDNGTNPNGGDICQAAAFLREFIPPDVSNCCCTEKLPFIHIDMYNVGLLSQTSEEVEPYYRKGIKMGRPTRGLIQFLYHRACLQPTTKQAVKSKK